MKIVRFSTPAGPRIGVITPAGVIDLHQAALDDGPAWAAALFTDIRCFLASGAGGIGMARLLSDKAMDRATPLSAVKLLAPVESGSKLIAHVVNYPGHDKEAKVKIPVKPFFFLKTSSSVCNPDDPIYTHPVSAKLDHEVELTIVIGAPVRDATAESAMSSVAGYTICNDVSYRDLQMNEGFPDINSSYGKNWTQAKGLDNACPVGPWLVLADEMVEPYPLDITCRVNGEVRQHDNTSNMIHKVTSLIVEASKGMTLLPGDLILTGTCAGGGLGDGRFLKPGDVVECEIERIGVLRNVVRAQSAIGHSLAA